MRTKGGSEGERERLGGMKNRVGKEGSVGDGVVGGER